MTRFPVTSQALFRLAFLAALLFGQWVLPWAHVEFDHDHAAGHGGDCSGSVAMIGAVQHEGHPSTECSICDWIRTANVGLAEPDVVVDAVPVVDFARPGGAVVVSFLESGASNPRAPPFVV